jgi:tRNA (guanosine-2'-O-)-methyltransferase
MPEVATATARVQISRKLRLFSSTSTTFSDDDLSDDDLSDNNSNNDKSRQKLTFGEQLKAIARNKTYPGQEVPDWDQWEYGSFSTSKHTADKLQPMQDELQLQKDDVSIFNETDANYAPFWESLSMEDVHKSIDTLSKYIREARKDKFDEVLGQRTDQIRFVFDSPANANNVWAALRSFDIFGIQYVDVISERPAYEKSWRYSTMKTAMGAQKWLSLRSFSNTSQCIQSLKDRGYRILVSDIHTSSRSLYDIDFSIAGNECIGGYAGKQIGDVEENGSSESVEEPGNHRGYVIVMGNEEHGVSEEVKNLADERFFIPMKGFAESFNLAAASAVTCSVLESRGVLKANLSEEQKTRIMLMWMARTVPRSIVHLKTAGLLRGNEMLWGSVAGFTTKP